MKRLLALVVLVLAATLLPARAQSPDEQYVHIYTLITQADALNEAGQSSQALGKYVEAQSALRRLQKVFPDWSPKIVNFRLNYLEAKVAFITTKAPISTSPKSDATNVQTTAQAAAPTAQSEADRKLAALEDEVRRLQADRTVLEAKLKEALATQPASVDPRELAKAEEKIQSLMREKDLLEVAISRQKGETPAGVDQKTLDEIKSSLAETGRKLTEQTERANSLALEKEALQKRFDKLASTAANTSELDRVKKELEAANSKLTGQTELANKLAVDKDALQTRLNTLSASAETADALRAENEFLKKQVSDLKSAVVAAGSADEEKNRRAQAEARLAVLTSEVEVLRLEKTTLQDRLKQASAAGAENAARIKQLERESGGLRKQLASTEKGGFFGRKNKAGTARIKELTDQVDSMRARLGILEAKAVPYTAEELAILQPPQTQLVAAESKSTGKSSKELPPGATALAAEAHRLFSAKQFGQAEQKYLEILRQDESNVYTLANLAAIQLELGHLDEAEKHARKALASAPNDAYSLSILGYLKFRQEKYDDAFGALSRAAQFDPQNAEIQNYLGVVLSHKGMRAAAETALRKAIMIEPGYASAQNNLAVFYATEQPPLLGLARWHYQKARDAGHPRNEELEKMLELKTPAPAAQ